MSSSRLNLCAMVMVLVATGCDARTSNTDVNGYTSEAETSISSSGASGRTNATRKNGFVQDIESLTERNEDFRHVLYTARNLQLVLMSIPAGEHIGSEAHDADQFFRVESGSGRIVIDGKASDIRAGSAMIVPAGATHDVVAGDRAPLKLYTLYAPPNHRDGVVHHVRADAEHDDEKFDGRTTE